MDKKGLPRLPRVMQRIHDKGRLAERPPVSYEVFDILYKGYRPVLREPLIRRKGLLLDTLSPTDSVHLCHFQQGDGIAFFQAVTDLGLEGMVAKQSNGIYVPGRRSRSWLKVKAFKTGNLVVGGYTIGGGYRKDLFGSVLLGAYDGEGLRFLGSVGGGFGKEDMGLTHSLLTQAHADVSPFVDPPQVERLLYWCEPRLVMQVKFGELTEAGHLRFPVFTTLRFDIEPRDCTIEALKEAGSSS